MGSQLMSLIDMFVPCYNGFFVQIFSVDDMVTSTNEDMLHVIHQKDINSRGLTVKHMEKFETNVRYESFLICFIMSSIESKQHHF